MSSAFDLLNKRAPLSSQKSDESNGSSRKRRLLEDLVDEDESPRSPARSKDSRWQPVEENLKNVVAVLEPARPSLKETAAAVDRKTKELTDWIAGRLENHSWNTSNRDIFRGKLTTYQSVQINGHEKNLADVLVKDVGTAARQKVPDELKKDLVASVQEFLKNNESVLRYFHHRSRGST
ncbi:hypothetical protein BV898_04004 [Hypsibius exemplaris]|uniref:Uncharacterized protein n=1 Tax=Hypsibius exemplaris TaxID=2072580 RepID=A0A1W0X3Z9_HYPEX|nr:hypothetical protein BV898_04004 [Hypsibius exemplaris]